MKTVITTVIIALAIVSFCACGSTKGTNVRRGTQWVDGHYQVVETPLGPKRVWVRGRWE